MTWNVGRGIIKSLDGLRISLNVFGMSPEGLGMSPGHGISPEELEMPLEGLWMSAEELVTRVMWNFHRVTCNVSHWSGMSPEELGMSL